MIFLMKVCKLLLENLDLAAEYVFVSAACAYGNKLSVLSKAFISTDVQTLQSGTNFEAIA